MERQCDGKVQHGTEAEAQQEAARMARVHGEPFQHYRCGIVSCGAWHVGHVPFAKAPDQTKTVEMNQMKNTEQDVDIHEGEVVAAPDISTLATLNKSEIDQQITTARAYPRSIKQFKNEALQLATLDEQTASECIYALPRDGKTIEGPSARFAEILAYAWGNNRSGARMMSDEGEFVKAQGAFFDLEKNVAISYEVSRRITNKKGQRYSLDMIGTTANAASSIALRNAVLKVIPKALWKPIYDAARKVVAGDFSTLANRRAAAIKEFALFGVKPEQLYAALEVRGSDDVTIDHLVVLKGMLNTLKSGESTPEMMFPDVAGNDRQHVAGKTDTATADLSKKYAQPSPAPEEPQGPSQAPASPQPQAPAPAQPEGMAAVGTILKPAKTAEEAIAAVDNLVARAERSDRSRHSTRPTEPSGVDPHEIRRSFGE